MTSIPPPPPEGEFNEAPPRQRRRWPVAVAWLVIIAAVAFIIYRGQTAERAPQGEEEWGGAARLSLSVNGRYIVATKAFMRGTSQFREALFVEHVQVGDGVAKSPAAQLRWAAVAGELIGPEDALQRVEDVIATGKLTGADAAAAAAMADLYRHGRGVLTSEEKAAVRSLEWFGELALSYGQDDSEPQRAAVLAAAAQTMIVVVLMFVLGGLALLAGFALLVLGLVLMVKGKLAALFVPPAAEVGDRVFESAAVWLGAMVFLALLARSIASLYNVDLTWGVYPLVLFAPFWPLVRGVSWAELRQAMGWHAGRGLWRELASGLAGYLAGLPIMMLAMGVTLVLMRLVKITPGHPFSDWVLGGGAWARVALLVLAAAWAPLMEESIFRGAIYQHVRNWGGPVVAVLLTGCLFGVIHPQGFVGLPMIMAMGCNFAVLREWRGSLIAPMVAHGLNNGLITLILVLALG